MSDSAARDAYADAKFTAEISTRMQVPDRIMVAPGETGSAPASASSPSRSDGDHLSNDLGLRRRDPRLDMQVPDRILVAGDDQHVASKSTPRELQMEAAVLPPTSDHVRVSTPPRSIRLDEHSFPSATDEESLSNSTPTLDGDPAVASNMSSRTRDADGTAAGAGAGRALVATPESQRHQGGAGRDSSLGLLSEGAREGLAPHEELHLIRRQLAKLNHRLMAVELENQQQQQREMVFTLLMSAYVVGKLVLWINRSWVQ